MTLLFVTNQHLSIHSSVHLSVCWPLCLLASVFFSLFICLYVNCLCIYLPHHLSFYQTSFLTCVQWRSASGNADLCDYLYYLFHLYHTYTVYTEYSVWIQSKLPSSWNLLTINFIITIMICFDGYVAYLELRGKLFFFLPSYFSLSLHSSTFITLMFLDIFFFPCLNSTSTKLTESGHKVVRESLNSLRLPDCVKSKPG